MQDWESSPTRVRDSWSPIETLLPEIDTGTSEGIFVPGESAISTYHLLEGKNCLAHLRATNSLALEDWELAIILLSGKSSALILSPGYNYRFSFSIFSEKEVTIKGARFKLHAGRRLAGSPSYEEIRRPLASAAILINSETQAAHRYPKTLYNDGSSESSDKQEEFDLFLKEGWNKVEILATLADQLGAERDFNDVSDPYAQIRLFPDLLKEEVRNALGLGEVIASGEFKPLDAFDLEWNKEPHPKYWAWAYSPGKIVVNVSEVESDLIAIDGTFKGSLPRRTFSIETIGMPSASLFVRFDFRRDPLSAATPLLNGYQLYAT
jgi:hypothetical protein